MLWPCFLLRRRAGQFSLEDSTHPDSHRSAPIPTSPPDSTPSRSLLLSGAQGRLAPAPEAWRPLPHSFWSVPLVPSELSTGSVAATQTRVTQPPTPVPGRVRLGLQSQEAPCWHAVGDRASPGNHGPPKSSEASIAPGASPLGNHRGDDAGVRRTGIAQASAC